MHGLAVLGLVIIIFILIINRRVSGLTSSTSQCANCPTKPSGTYYTTLEGCTTGTCATCPTVANGINTLTPCTDATSTNPTGSPGSCTLTCNQGYSIGTDGKSCVADCVGAWGACSTTCGPGEYTYEVSTPAGPGGKSCKDVDGTIRNQGDKKPCANPDCGQNCEGVWSAFGGCSSVCGYGTKTRKFTATKEARNGGAACETTYGLNAHWPESYETTACTDLPACTSGKACQGSWSDWGTCSASCDGGIRKKTYNVDSAATVGTDGTRGAACPYVDGEQQSEACNTQSCCSKAAVGEWEKYGSVRCSGNSSGKPEQLWVRNIVFPAGTPVNTTAASCSISQFATQYTAAGCTDVTPTAGTCSVTGVTWNATDGCKLSPATDTPSNGTCSDSTVAWNSTRGCTLPATATPSGATCEGTNGTTNIIGADLAGNSKSYGKYTRTYNSTTKTCAVTPAEYYPAQATCPPNLTYQPGWGFCYGTTTPGDFSTYTSVMPTDIVCDSNYTKVIPPESRRLVDPPKCVAIPRDVKSYTCPAGYVSDLVNKTCKAKTGITISTLTCPANYTANKTTNKCTANPVSISGLTCPSPYWSENRTINKCSATTVGDAAPPP